MTNLQAHIERQQAIKAATDAFRASLMAAGQPDPETWQADCDNANAAYNAKLQAIKADWIRLQTWPNSWQVLMAE